MRPYAIASLLALASFTVVAGACNFKLGKDTEGEMGNLRFAYSGTGCFFGCGLDKKVLQGAKVTVTVTGDTQGGLTGTIEDGSAARVSTQTESCTCNSGTSTSSHSRLLHSGERCESSETMTCSMSVEVFAQREGYSKLKVLDGRGAVVDQVDIMVTAAARIDVAVTVDEHAVEPKSDGVYALKVHAHGKILAKAIDSEGDELFWSRDGLTYTYADGHVVVSEGASFLSASDESFASLTEGDAKVDVATAGGSAHSTVRFHVGD